MQLQVEEVEVLGEHTCTSWLQSSDTNLTLQLLPFPFGP